MRRKRCIVRLTRCVFVSLLSICLTAGAFGQDSRASQSKIRQLDSQAQKAEQEFLKSMFDLANDFENAGEIDRSRELLQSMLKLRPDATAVKDKLKQYDEGVFDRNSKTVDLDVSQGWLNTGIIATKELPMRIQATGTYRLLVNDELGPQGYPQNDAGKDLIADLPTGALIGSIAPADRNRKQKGAAPPATFLIGESSEFKPKSTGTLFIRVNTPPQAKCSGRLRVKFSGNISR